jgi:hypothetical protein
MKELLPGWLHGSELLRTNMVDWVFNFVKPALNNYNAKEGKDGSEDNSLIEKAASNRLVAAVINMIRNEEVMIKTGRNVAVASPKAADIKKEVEDSDAMVMQKYKGLMRRLYGGSENLLQWWDQKKTRLIINPFLEQFVKIDQYPIAGPAALVSSALGILYVALKQVAKLPATRVAMTVGALAAQAFGLPTGILVGGAVLLASRLLPGILGRLGTSGAGLMRTAAGAGLGALANPGALLSGAARYVGGGGILRATSIAGAAYMSESAAIQAGTGLLMGVGGIMAAVSRGIGKNKMLLVFSIIGFVTTVVGEIVGGFKGLKEIKEYTGYDYLRRTMDRHLGEKNTDITLGAGAIGAVGLGVLMRHRIARLIAGGAGLIGPASGGGLLMSLLNPKNILKLILTSLGLNFLIGGDAGSLIMGVGLGIAGILAGGFGAVALAIVGILWTAYEEWKSGFAGMAQIRDFFIWVWKKLGEYVDVKPIEAAWTSVAASVGSLVKWFSDLSDLLTMAIKNIKKVIPSWVFPASTTDLEKAAPGAPGTAPGIPAARSAMSEPSVSEIINAVPAGTSIMLRMLSDYFKSAPKGDINVTINAPSGNGKDIAAALTPVLQSTNNGFRSRN